MRLRSWVAPRLMELGEQAKGEHGPLAASAGKERSSASGAIDPDRELGHAVVPAALLPGAADDPAPDVSRGFVELDADLHQVTTVRLVGHGVALGVDLSEGVLGGAGQLELEDEEARGGPDDSVCASLGGAHLGLDELAHEGENQVEDHLVVALRLVVELVVPYRAD